jgi:hypothetical protein
LILRVQSNAAQKKGRAGAVQAEQPAQAAGVQGEDLAVEVMQPPKPRGRPKKAKAPVPVGEPTIPVVVVQPVVITQPVVVAQPVTCGQPTLTNEQATNELVATTQSVPWALQADNGDNGDNGDDDDAEVIDIHIPDNDLDTMMNSTILGLPSMTIDPADNGKGEYPKPGYMRH